MLMLWSAPRSRSTAFYRMMTERDVAASSGLAPVPSRRGLDAEQHPLLDTYLDYHLPLYQKLYQRRLAV
jgi:hypothetical protein